MLALVAWGLLAYCTISVIAALALRFHVERLRQKCAKLDAMVRANRRTVTLDDAQATGLCLDTARSPVRPAAPAQEISACDRYFSPWAAGASRRPMYFNHRPSGETLHVVRRD